MCNQAPAVSEVIS